jgi:hypothetical protein
MHSDVVGQAIPYRLVPVTSASLQALVPAAGSLELRTFPRRSTAKHVEADGQEMPNSGTVGSSEVSVHALPPAGGVVVVTSAPSVTVPGWAEATHSPAEVHETPVRAAGASGASLTAQAVAPPAGFVDVSRWPFKPTATHTVLVHDTVRNPVLTVGPEANVHAAVPPVGLVEVTMFAPPSRATHELVEGHETVCSPWLSPVTVVACHAALPPAGFVEMNTDEGASPTATQSEVEGHETLHKRCVSMLATCHDWAPEVGEVDVTTLPALSTATHREVLGQEIASSWFALSTGVTVHAAAPPVGSLEVTTLPALSTVAQKLSVGQDTPVRKPPST